MRVAAVPRAESVALAASLWLFLVEMFAGLV
jgi:hypothetical protein